MAQIEISPEELSDAEQTPAAIREDLRLLESELARIETQFDAYNPAISEISLDLADRLMDRSLYADALVSYRRALHVTRINEGLDTEKQIPILEDIIEAHYRLGEYEEAGDNLSRLSAVYSRSYDQMNPEMIPHLMDRGDWHLGAFFYGFGSSAMQHLMEAHNAYNQVADIREEAGMPYDPTIYGILSAVNYNMAVYLESAEAASSLSLADSDGERGINSNFAGNSYRRGKGQLERALALAQKSENQGDSIIALVQLADWEQLFRKRFSAREKYLEAYEQTLDLSPEDELFGLFDTPKLLPAFGVSELINSPPDRETLPVELSLDITAWGTSRNVKVQEVDEDSASARALRAAVRTANSSVFRPIIVDGQPARADNVSQTVIVSI